MVSQQDLDDKPVIPTPLAGGELPGRLRPLRTDESSFRLDLKDEARIRQYLESFDSFADAPNEGRDYIHHSLRRFIITAEMIPQPSKPHQRLLEIGASPYYTTLLLRRLRGYEIYMTNYFGDAYPRIGRQIIANTRYDEAYECNFVNINVERDRLPYPDDSFDVALFCEVIEHLTQDPTFALAELHRVLKPDGYLLVTTPNVFRLQHLMLMLGGRRNLFHPYSGHGVYGRHQREYGLGELKDLLQGCGFAIIRAEIRDFERGGTFLEHGLKRVWAHRRDNLFVLSQSSSPRRLYYPGWLYVATQGIEHVVDSDVSIGVNDVGHFAWGWWATDVLPEYSVRWSTGHALVSLALPKRDVGEIVIEANGMGASLGPVLVTLDAGGGRREFQLADDLWHDLAVPLPGGKTTLTVACEVWATPVRCPKSLGVNADDRSLGVMVRRLYVH